MKPLRFRKISNSELRFVEFVTDAQMPSTRIQLCEAMASSSGATRNPIPLRILTGAVSDGRLTRRLLERSGSDTLLQWLHDAADKMPTQLKEYISASVESTNK